jgi:inosine/xanthosine triphosphate pyrophosphatase family protein
MKEAELSLRKCRNVPDDDMRSARFHCCCVLVVNENDIRSECGVLEGRIGYEMKGKIWFWIRSYILSPRTGSVSCRITAG